MAEPPSSRGGPDQGPDHRNGTRLTRGRPRQGGRRRRACAEGSLSGAALLQWRNSLVCQNLGLVHMVARRESDRSGRPYDDLCSAGYEGLIRAVQSFDAGSNLALSSFAVPHILGAIRMDHRDRQQPLHTPRRLRELLQRSRRLQEKRRSEGLSPLEADELAAALGCSLARLQQAQAVQRALGVTSLDQPIRGSNDNDEGESLLDQIHAASPRAAEEQDPQLGWLRQFMGGLDPADRELLEARWIDGLTWSAVAELLGWRPLDCRRRAEPLRCSLQEASSQLEPSRARPAANAV